MLQAQNEETGRAAGPGLSASDATVNPGQVEPVERSRHRLARQEPDYRPGLPIRR